MNTEDNSSESRIQSLRSSIRSKRSVKILLGILGGGLAGFLYFWFVGCNSGTCPITSNPFSSVFTGSLMGLVLTT